MRRNEIEHLLQQIQAGMLNIDSCLKDFKRLISDVSKIAGQQKNLEIVRKNADFAETWRVTNDQVRDVIRLLTEAGISIDIEEIVGEKWNQ